MAMLPTLPSAQRMADLLGNRAKRFFREIPVLNRFRQRCRKRSGAFANFSMK